MKLLPAALVSIASLASSALGCAPSPAVAPPAQAPKEPARLGQVREGTPIEVDIAASRAEAGKASFAWQNLSPAAFAEARRDHKYILLDGAAEWCHWCHVMDETTYLDPEVGRILKERFVTIRVDVDEHPDIAERYGAWGWPATIVFSPEAEELGKYRGYLPPKELLEILQKVEAAAKGAFGEGPKGPQDIALGPEALPWIAGRTILDFDSFYDEKEGGWGKRQKAALGLDAEFEVLRGARGDAAALSRATFSLKKYRALLDPVWGGVYQYSAAPTWDEPHYEKLMPYQTANLEAFARGFAATRDPSLLADAKSIAGYLNGFLSRADGGFFVSQDADVNAHDRKTAFIDGDVYYRLDDKGRRALGVPRVDDHVFGYENGLAIAAFATLYEASRDTGALDRAKRAAEVMLKEAVASDGAVHRGTMTTHYLADAASLGRGLARLAEVSNDARYREAALSIAKAMKRDLEDEATGTYWDHTPDKAAAGVFARRAKPFVQNVLAARFYASLAKVTGDASWKDRAKRLLAAVATPRAIDERGRMLGDLLLAFNEVDVIPWR